MVWSSLAGTARHSLLSSGPGAGVLPLQASCRKPDAQTEWLPEAALTMADVGPLFEVMQPRLLCFLRGQCSLPAEEAQDVAQEAFLRLCRSIARGKQIIPACAYSWLRVTAVRFVISHARRRQKVGMAPLEREGQPPLDVAAPLDGETQATIRLLAEDALASLSGMSAEVVLLAACDYTCREIAAYQQRSLTTVRRDLRRARAALRAAQGGAGERPLYSASGGDRRSRSTRR